MRPAWHLAINNLSERRSRTALLVATVALSALLISAVTTAMASLHKGIRHRVEATVGAADLRLQHVGKRQFDAAVVSQIEAWPEVELVVGRGQDAVPLHNPRTDKAFSPIGYGIMVDREQRLRPQKIIAGRPVNGTGQVVLDQPAAKELDAQVGDTLNVNRFGEPVSLRVVGIVEPAPMGGLARPECYVSLGQLGEINGWIGKVREVDIVVKKGVDPQAVETAHAGDFEKGLLLRVSSKITSGLYQNIQSSQLGMVLVTALAFLAAAFIIMTGLTTNVTERQRELAVLRCIGGTRSQLAEAQLLVGGLIGTAGALIGVPLGVGAAGAIVGLFPDQLPGGLAVSVMGLVTAVVGAVGSGVAGAAWPAFRASRTSPLAALASRSVKPSKRGLVLCTCAGILGIAIHLMILSVTRDPNFVLWGDVSIGLPSMFTGYFLIAVPVTLGVAFTLSPIISKALSLPPGLLGRTVAATPYRHGFTAGAMMVGLALMVAIWTNGRAVMTDWLDTMKFPDAFVFGRSLSKETQRRIEAISGVTATCAITMQPVNPKNVFGIPGIQQYDTTFIAFEPEPFFAMAELKFDEGNKEHALKRLLEGGAVMVAREFKTARGLGVGDTITLTAQGKPFDFEIVGVVNSPGLDIVNKFFDIGEQYIEQSVSAVFGSRNDLVEKFGNDAINLIQIGIDPAVDDVPIVKQAQRIPGIISAGSGRQIKEEIGKFLQGSLMVFSVVAVAAMLVACFGVANLIVAGIQARQFEFGVLRAIGAHKGLLARLVLAEAVIIAVAACLLGTVMGMHAAWGGQRVNSLLIGLTLTRIIPPLGATAAGWGMLMTITLGAALPAVLRLMKRQPRELLAAMKG